MNCTFACGERGVRAGVGMTPGAVAGAWGAPQALVRAPQALVRAPQALARAPQALARAPRALARALCALLVACACAAPLVAFAPPLAAAGPGTTIAPQALPAEARETLALIRKGGPFPYRQDGVEFGNRERRLPLKPRGYYREYTVKTPGSRDRGARRIVAGSGSGGDVRSSGEYWYTSDHYNSFRRISE